MLPPYLVIFSLYSLSILSILSQYSLYSLSILSILSQYSLYTLSLFSLYSLSILSLYSLYSLSILSILYLFYTLSILFLYSLYSLYTLSILSLFSLYTLSILSLLYYCIKLCLCSELITFVASRETHSTGVAEPIWRGYVFSVGLLISQLVQTSLFQQLWYLCVVAGFHVRASLISIIYKKVRANHSIHLDLMT